MVKLTCPRPTSRGIWHSLGIELCSRNSHPTSNTITPRTHNLILGLIKTLKSHLFNLLIFLSIINLKLSEVKPARLSNKVLYGRQLVTILITSVPDAYS